MARSGPASRRGSVFGRCRCHGGNWTCIPVSSARISDNQNIPNLVKEQPVNQSSEASSDIPETKLVEIKSPMPGTFYSAPDPESASFVNIGDNVNAGDTICIVEAMKIMNEIQAEESGVIEEILVDNSSPVEFDQVLFKLKPSK